MLNAEAIQNELNVLERSVSFRRAPGLIALLRFVTEAELRGDGPELKETLLGTTLYNRDAEYDPKVDGIVRVNANRLRARLNDHYRRFPSHVQISLNAGSYRPVFRVELPESEPESEPASASAPEPIELLPPPGLVTSSRRPWLMWTAAALFLVAVIPALWLWRRGNQERWTARWLTRMSGVQQFPAFAPDGLHLAYTVSDPVSDSSSIYLQGLDSDTPTMLSTHDRFESRPAWSPDGKQLAFIVRDPDHTVHVLVRPVNQARETEIYSHAASGPWLCDVPRLSWSHNGDEILTTAPPSPEEMAANPDQSHGCGLIAINVSTHATRRLTHSPSATIGDLEPAVSPDGKTVAFFRGVSYNSSDLYQVNIDGSGEHRIHDIRSEIQGVTWMPDGKSLLLCARMEMERLHIVRLDLRSGRITTIHTGAAPMGFADITPNGRSIAYTEYHQQNELLRLKDGHIQKVFDDGVLREHPTFSPDATRIAYSSDRRGQDQLWVSDRDGKGETPVPSNPGMQMLRPIWSADGRSLIFECRQGGPSRICAMNLKTHKLVTLVQMQHDAILPSLSSDGKRLYFTSNDSGEYAGYRQTLSISPSGDLSPNGVPERMTLGGTGFIREAPLGNMLYLQSALPMQSLLAVPISRAPVSMASVNHTMPEYVLRQWTSVNDRTALTNDGFLNAEERDGHYRLYLYKQTQNNPVELPAQSITQRIESIAWDPKDKSVLLETRSTPIGALITLSKQ